MIRKITSQEDQQQYQQMAKYCFFDTIGWTDRMFPLPKPRDFAMGLFQGEHLISGVINRRYQVNLWGEKMGMTGISGVASLPEARRKGGVRQVMNQVIREGYLQGDLVSALYPFKFGFYEKFGYGYLGGLRRIQFDPRDLKRSDFTGSARFYNGSQEDFASIQGIIDHWSRGFSFGATWEDFPKESHDKALKESKHHEVLIFDQKGEAVAFLAYEFTSIDKPGTSMDINKAAWSNPSGWKGIVDFLGKHIDQCSQINWIDGGQAPLTLELKEPRPRWTQEGCWMARPLVLDRILQIFVDRFSYTGTVEISTQDPVLPENSGTYLIHQGQVSRTEELSGHFIPFSLLSALLFGSITPKEALLSGALPEDTPQALLELFGNSHSNYYVSEFF